MLIRLGFVILAVVAAGCGDGGVEVDDPCDGVSCSGHGSCTSASGSAECVCEQGYHAEGLGCSLPTLSTELGPQPNDIELYICH